MFPKGLKIDKATAYISCFLNSLNETVEPILCFALILRKEYAAYPIRRNKTMSLKDNFNQAVKEILKKDGLVGKNLSDEAKKSSELEGFLGEASADGSPASAGSRPEAPSYGGEETAPAGSAASESTPPPAQNPQFSYGNNSYTEESSFAYSSDPYGGMRRNDPNIVPPPQPRGTAPSEQRYNDNEETTIISKNIVITGGTVTGFANVRIDGSIKGDVKITKDVNVTGKVVGDIECNNAIMAGSSIQGSINSKGQIRMDRDSVLLGDVNTQYLDMNGRIKGTVDVSGKAEFKSDSVIIGDITASTITVLDGAVIKGYVNTTFLQESSANVFPETITVSDQ